MRATVSNTAYSKARKKLRHSAFIELNTACVVVSAYEDDDYQTWNGRRILAVDGSKIILPNNASTASVFGTITNTGYTNNEYCFAMASVLYDVLNGVCLDARLTHSRSYEVDLAVDAFDQLEEGDIVIYDRNYCSFYMAFQASQANGDFLIRCPSNASVVARDMLEGKGDDDIIYQLPPPPKLREEGYCEPITIRYVRVVLDTGEFEVLMTSLLDQQLYPTEIFKELYWKRWGVETFYSILKGRLDLENFTGHSAEAVLQDFHASVLLVGMEAIFSRDANEALAGRDTRNDQQVNKAVSFNAMKSRVFDLLLSDRPIDQVIDELETVFLTNPVAVRKGRSLSRSTNSGRRLQFWRRRRKSIY